MLFGSVNTAVLAINNSKVDDVDLRRAICYAVDRNVLLNNAYAGLGRPQTTLALPEGWAYNPDVPGFSYDPERAAAILDAAGYIDTNGDGIREKDGKPLNLDFQARGDGEWLLVTQIIQQFLGDVGIGTTITPADRDTYYANMRTGAYDLGWWISNAQPEPPIVEYVFHSGDYWNVTHLVRPRVDELVTTGRSTASQADRAVAFKELQEIFYDEAIQCQQFWVQQAHVLSADLAGFKTNSRGVLYSAQDWHFE
jgi:peptide/nickel transport system substrate-binding protein